MKPSDLLQKATDLQNLGRLDEAIAAYQEVIALDEHSYPAWYAQGCAWEKKGDHVTAMVCFHQAISISPERAESHHNFGKALHELGLTEQAIDQFRAALALGLGFLPRTSIATLIPGSPAADNLSILGARRQWAETHLPPLDPDKSFAREPLEGRRLRIGYLSSFFQSRNWMKPVWGLINHHDREGFQIYLFSDAPEAACRDCYRKHPSDQYHDITDLTNRVAAELIEGCRLDLLVDLNGYSCINRLAVLSLKPAPIIAGWFNFYATSGMRCFDYLIGDSEVIRPDDEEFYTERILRIPGCYLTFEVLYPTPEVVNPPSLSAEGLTFGCLASNYKITEPVVDAWSGILLAAQGTRLFLKNAALRCKSNREFLVSRFEARGVARDRIMMEGPAEHFEYLAAYGRVDIALDTFPYNGGTTTSEAIWQGVPVLTFPGDRWAARQGASLNRAAGLGEFVAKDLDDFIARAIAWARSADAPARLAELRRNMRSRLARAPLCDTVRFAAEMEQLYREIIDAQICSQARCHSQ